MIQVYYDGQCHHCHKEIAYYQKIAPEGIFIWHPIAEAEEALQKANISTVDALKILHVQDASGRMHLGVDGFILIWQQIPGWKFLATCIQVPGIYFTAKIFYSWFAHRRFKRLEHCKIALHHDKDTTS